MRPKLLLPVLLLLGVVIYLAKRPVDLDAAARRFVILGIALGKHDPAYVDAYYGPDTL